MASGKPDYWQPTYPSRPILGPKQERYRHKIYVLVGAGSSESYEAPTVDAGKNLYLNLVIASCEASCLQEVEIKEGTFTIIKTHFDVEIVIPCPEGGTWPIAENSNATIVLYNNDTVARYMRCYLLGTAEEYK